MAALDFHGRCVIVTGAGRGIGRAHALEFARRGAVVVVNDVSANPAEDAVKEIVTTGGEAIAVVADIGQPSSGAEVVARAVEKCGRVDGVIVNASTGGARKTFTEVADADLDAILSVNVDGAWRLLQAAWPFLAASGFGRVLVTTSQAALYGMPSLSEYALVKAALLGLMRALALEGAPLGINVNAIAPAAATRMTEETVRDATALALLRDLQPPHLIPPLAVWLLHPSCSVSGEIYVTGGAHISRAFMAETAGVTFAPVVFTAETVRDQFDQVRAEAGYRVPRDVSESGDVARKAEVMQRLKALGVIA